MRVARDSQAWNHARLEFEIAATVRRLRIDRRLKHLLAELTKTVQMASPIDRLKEKLNKASGVAQRATAAIEAQADALIAEEDNIGVQTKDAFAPHIAILSEAKSELQAVKDALNIMGNGGPPLAEPDTTAAPISQGMPIPEFDIHNRRDRPR